MTFNNERELKGWYMDFLKMQGCSVYNIESHNNRGIPDLLVMREKFGDFLVELKNDKKAELKGIYYDIKYRPGQIAWHHDYLQAHSYLKCVLVLVATKEGLLLVPSVQCSVVIDLQYDALLLRDMKPGIMLLKIMSELPASNETSRRGLFVDYVRHVFWHDWDFDADVLWNELLPGWDIEENYTGYDVMWRIHIAVVKYWYELSAGKKLRAGA